MDNQNESIFSIAREFSDIPGPRYKEEGDWSGQELREDRLATIINNTIAQSAVLTIDLDGTAGYGTSFLEEVFGGLIRDNKISVEDLERSLKFKSLEEPYLIADIWSYIHDASNKH